MGIPVEHFQLLRLLKIFRVFRMKVTATVFALLVCTLLEALAKNLVTFKEPTDAEMLDLSHDIMYPEDYDELERDEDLENSRRKRSAEEEEGEFIDLSHLYPEDYNELETDEDLENSRRKRSAEEEEGELIDLSHDYILMPEDYDELERDEEIKNSRRKRSAGAQGAETVHDWEWNKEIQFDCQRSGIKIENGTYHCDLLNEELNLTKEMKEICDGKVLCSFSPAQLLAKRNCVSEPEPGLGIMAFPSIKWSYTCEDFA